MTLLFPGRLLQKFEEGREFDWDDLRQLLRRTLEIDKDRITTTCIQGFRFLADLTPEEQRWLMTRINGNALLWQDLTTQPPIVV